MRTIDGSATQVSLGVALQDQENSAYVDSNKTLNHQQMMQRKDKRGLV